MKSIMNIGVVNFQAIWGNKEENLSRIVEYTEAAGKRGCEFLVFPETALTGYDDDPTTTVREEKMHDRLAETIPGPATEAVAEVAKKYGMYVVFGMSELADDKKTVYNSAAIIYPDGKTESYRKLHLPFSEGNWSIRGDKPVLIDTPWGPVGISICYDTYHFNDILSYSRAKGARLHLNVTACPINSCTRTSSDLTIKAYSYVYYMFIATANLCGKDLNSYFHGGSSVIGPAQREGGAYYPDTYVGEYFNAPGSEVQGLKLGTIDLDIADRVTEIPTYRVGPSGAPDFRPELYKWMMDDIVADPYWTDPNRK